MEDFLLALVSGIFEILAEAFFQVALEAIVALVTRSIRNLFAESNIISPILAALGYLLLGIAAGVATVLLFPHRLVPPSKIHGISLIVSPLITGLIMSHVGALLRRRGKRAVKIESFAYGFTFALGVAIIRFAYLRQLGYLSWKQTPRGKQEAINRIMTVSHILGIAFSALAIFGVVTSTVFSFLVAAGVRRFRSLPTAISDPPYLPPVSVLKALHGDEPDLEANLASIFEQDYPNFEILLCARHSNDLGLEAGRRVAARYPHISSRILTCGEPPWPNARTFSLEIMRREARHEILVSGDSDVRVGRDYLASVVQPMRDPNVGMVTCVYRGVTRHGLWAQLEAMGMSVEMTSGVLVANLLEGMQFALGPSMVMRQSSVEKIGGFEKVAQYYADDFVLGNWIAQSGEKVILSPYIIEHHVLNASLKSSIAHQQGWATSTRFSRPMGHLGEVLTYAVPFGLLGLIALAAVGHPWFGLGLLSFTVLARLLLCILVAGAVVRDEATLRKAWLYPLRDFMGFCFWVRSYFGGNRLKYRGEPYELLPEGRLRKLDPEI